MSNFGNQKVKYVMIGKATEIKELGEFPSQPVSEWAKDCKKIFVNYCASNVESKLEQRNKVKVKESSLLHYFYINEQKIFFVALVDSSYSENLVFRMFDDIQKENIPLLRDEKGKLNTIGLSKLKDIINSYQTAQEKSTINEINKDINDLKQNMRKNVTSIVNNIEDADALKVQSDQIKEGTHEFYTKANDLRKEACWQNYKLWIIGTLVVLGIIAIIIIVVVATKNGGKDDKNDDTVVVVNDDNKNPTRILFDMTTFLLNRLN